MIEYSTDAQQRKVISGMKLLPEGKQDSGQLVSVAVVNVRADRSGGRGGEVGDLNSRQFGSNHKPRPSASSGKRNLGREEFTGADVASDNRASTAQEENNNKEQLTNKTIGKKGRQPCTSPWCSSQQETEAESLV